MTHNIWGPCHWAPSNTRWTILPQRRPSTLSICWPGCFHTQPSNYPPSRSGGGPCSGVTIISPFLFCSVLQKQQHKSVNVRILEPAKTLWPCSGIVCESMRVGGKMAIHHHPQIGQRWGMGREFSFWEGGRRPLFGWPLLRPCSRATILSPFRFCGLPQQQQQKARPWVSDICNSGKPSFRCKESPNIPVTTNLVVYDFPISFLLIRTNIRSDRRA